MFIIIPLVFFSCFKLQAQSKMGITRKPDTSFTIHSAYSGTVKSHPGIKLINELGSVSVATEKDLVYCTIENRKLLIDVFSPKYISAFKRTAILIIHGGGWRTGNRSLHHPLAERLADLGYVCFTPEYRLSTEALYPAAVHDIKSVIRWVRKNAAKYNIDSSKIMVAGHSAGGELVAFMGATNNMQAFEGIGCYENFSSKVNAVVDMDGVLAFIHPESGEGDDSKRISAATNWFGYSKTENPELWKQGSPLTHVGSHSPPILFINSAVERMHAGREDFIKVLNLHNIYSEVKTFEGSPHSFCFFEPWFELTVKHIDEFLKKIL